MPSPLSRPLLALAMAWLAPVASAQISLTCGAQTRLINSDNVVVATGGSDTTAPACNSQLFGSDGTANATALVALGVVKVDTHADTLGQAPKYPSINADARASAAWLDRFTISAPGFHNGQFGKLEFSVSLQGFIESFAMPEGQNGAFWRFEAGGGASGAVGAVMNTSFNGTDNSLVPLRGEFAQSWNLMLHGVINFRFDTLQALSMSLSLQTRANATGGTVDGVFGNSAYWGGISAVRGPGGQLLTLAAPGQPAGPGQYSMGTQSGFDWHPSLVPPAVPEPATGLLLLVGLPLLARRLRAARPPA